MKYFIFFINYSNYFLFLIEIVGMLFCPLNIQKLINYLEIEK